MRSLWRLHRFVLVLILLLLILALGACGSPDAGQASIAIIGGARERGYPAVGALVRDSGTSFDSFCTATLIHPEWLLTAGHCWVISGYEPWQVEFFVGDDARLASLGRTHWLESVYYPPEYDPSSPTVNDIALVHLLVPITDVAPMPYSGRALANGDGVRLTWVGFGRDDGVAQTGAGLKRRTSGDHGLVFATEYVHGPTTCQGDSGGPAFADFGAGETIVGVVSATTSSCTSVGTDTRVDVFAGWIAETIRRNTDCAFTGGDCGEGYACWPRVGGDLRCTDSAGHGDLETCDPGSVVGACADGLVCSPLSATLGVCLRACLVGESACDYGVCETAFDGVDRLGRCTPTFCGRPSECGASEDCVWLPGRTDLGLCRECADQDSDGHCASDDCNDSDPAAHPGAAEVCDNARDDDCDGDTDLSDADCRGPVDAAIHEDAGVPGADGSVDPGADAGAHSPRGRGGCACGVAPRAVSGGDGARWLLAALASLGVGLRRRRRGAPKT
ncbi:MAG: trypsin-like serine protease [Sandaracinaceae bacterium]|nr:trypsin-like serine protease [Sandaracinaceae bacterium]